MSKDKQTFIDPEIGEEIESTWLARWGSLIGGVLIGGVLIVLLSGLFGVLRYGLFPGLLVGPYLGLIFVLIAGLVSTLQVPEMEVTRNDPFTRWAHDRIARRQHRRLRRKLLDEEWANVPDTALSRAQPPGEPVPTDTALSLADEPDEPTHLSVSIEEDTQVVVDDSA